MFCCQDGCHYALTCFHVGLLNDEENCAQMVEGHDLLEIHKSNNVCTEYSRGQTYYYTERGDNNADKYTHLGNFHNGSLDSNSDIMSIKVPDDVKIDCHLTELDSPNWDEIWQELYRRTIVQQEQVQVEMYGYSSNELHGHIVSPCYSYKCGGEFLFHSAIIIKGKPQSMVGIAYSGALMCFYDEKKRRQPFAYVVGVVDRICLTKVATMKIPTKVVYRAVKIPVKTTP